MNSNLKSVGNKIFIGAICVCILIVVFGVGHYFGQLAEEKGNATFYANILTDLYDRLEANHLEEAKSKLRFLIYGNVMTHDQVFKLPIDTNSVSVRLWTDARKIARDEQTNVVPISEKILMDEINNFMKTNRIAKTNSATNP